MSLQNKVLPSKKLFSIDRVFRNETLDATHLAEFHQVRVVEFSAAVTVAPGVEGFRVSKTANGGWFCVCPACNFAG